MNAHVVQKEKKAGQTGEFEKKTATFVNEGKDPKLEKADLYFNEGQFWVSLGHGDPPAHVNTFEGHEWTLKVDGKLVRKWRIGKEKRYVFKV